MMNKVLFLPAFLLSFALQAAHARDAATALSALTSAEAAGLPAAPEATAPEVMPGRRPSMEPRASKLTGFISRVENRLYVASNLYFTAGGDSFLIEDFSGRQKFHLKGRELYVTLSDSGEFLLGRVSADLDGIAEGKRVPFELESGITSSVVHYAWRMPKVDYNFAAGITGFGWVRTVTGRTQRKVRLDLPEGGSFCFYSNIKGRNDQQLYRGSCAD